MTSYSNPPSLRTPVQGEELSDQQLESDYRCIQKLIRRSSDENLVRLGTLDTEKLIDGLENTSMSFSRDELKQAGCTDNDKKA